MEQRLSRLQQLCPHFCFFFVFFCFCLISLSLCQLAQRFVYTFSWAGFLGLAGFLKGFQVRSLLVHQFATERGGGSGGMGRAREQ